MVNATMVPTKVSYVPRLISLGISFENKKKIGVGVFVRLIYYIIYILFHLIFVLYNNIIFRIFTCFTYFCRYKCNQASATKMNKKDKKEATDDRQPGGTTVVVATWKSSG